jgi:transcriptional regulator with XRE-family HTH domain
MDLHEWNSEEIRRLRILLKLTQKDFAELLGVTRVYVNYLERRVRTPRKTLNLLLSYVEKELNENEKGKGGKKDGKRRI